MKPIQVLEDCDKYIIGVANTLFNLSREYRIEKNDQILLREYSEQLVELQKSLESMRNNWEYKKELEKKMLEETNEE